MNHQWQQDLTKQEMEKLHADVLSNLIEQGKQ